MPHTYVSVTSLDAAPGTLRLRVYSGGALLLDVPLGWRSALRLASDLLVQALVAERALQPAVLSDGTPERVAKAVPHTRKVATMEE